MGLPKIDLPVYELELISNNKKIKYRPFTVKEEKLFLMAAEAGDLNTIIETTKQVINNCVLDDIDIDQLPIFDIENIFLRLRSKSIGEVVTLKYRCNNNVKDENDEDKKCNNVVEIDVDLNDIVPSSSKIKENKVQISENLGVVLKYPNIKILESYNVDNESESILNTIIECIDYIYDKDSVYYSKDFSKEELVEFVESLQTKDLQKFKDFFDNIPKLQKNIHFKCSKCKHEEDVLVEGIESFFV
jgi:hypothetical protein